uniref:Peptidase_M23 n=1 Tax=uncultured Desulfotomaculum sp. TaxID=157294 RepID=A0A060BWF4_9FIRM|nr:peptidase_M23 [uncultured Desulfotomaculum sp.]
MRTFLSDGTQVDHLYLHSPMSSFTVSTGDHVNVGDQIAVVGSEGNSTGAHLHFEVRLNGGASAGPAYGGQVIDGLAWITQRDAYVMPACS